MNDDIEKVAQTNLSRTNYTQVNDSDEDSDDYEEISQTRTAIQPPKLTRLKSVYNNPKEIEINGWYRVPCTKVESQIDLKGVIYHINNKWGKKKPRLILSVTGGAQNFALRHDVQDAFKQGLIKAAKSTGAWIITGGTNYGVMRMVGDAVAEGVKTHDLTVLGIATEPVVTDGIVDNGVLKNNGDCKLNANHSHFILVYDSSKPDDKKKDFGQEIKFRARLEKELISNNSTETDSRNGHMVLIVVMGGKGTFETVAECLKESTPVLLLKGSGGCADTIIEAYEKKFEEDFESLLSKVVPKDHVKEVVGYMESIKASANLHPNLINIFKIENDKDIEQAILNALINKEKDTNKEKPAQDCTDVRVIEEDINKSIERFKHSMSLAVTWNAISIAKDELLLNNLNELRNKINKKPDKKISAEDASNLKEASTKRLNDALNELLNLAIIKKRPKFVDILLDSEIDIVSFLADKRLESLYINIIEDDKKSPFVFIMGNYERRDVSDTENLRQAINKRLKMLVWKDLELRENLLDTDRYPMQNLFILSLLLNRFEIAFIFWRRGDNQIINALFASQFLENLSNQYKSDNEELIEYSKKFENAAKGIMAIVDSRTHYFINYCALFRNVEYYQSNVLEVAIECRSKEFVSQPTVQNVFDDIWFGMIEKFGLFDYRFLMFLLSMLSFGLLAPVFYSREDISRKVEGEMLGADEKYAKSLKNEYNTYFQRIVDKLLFYYTNDDKERDKFLIKTGRSKKTNTDGEASALKPLKCYVNNYVAFMSTPMVHFSYTLVFYILFLFVYSHFLIEEFPSSKEVTESFVTSFGILIILFASLCAEEIHQLVNPVFKMKRMKQANYNIFKRIYFAIKFYFKDLWNIPDSCGLVIFFLATFFLIRYMTTIDENFNNYLQYSKFLFCIDLIIWFLRALHFCSLSQFLGPKLQILEKIIIDDMRFFIIIIGIISLAFGIVSHIALLQNGLDAVVKDNNENFNSTLSNNTFAFNNMTNGTIVNEIEYNKTSISRIIGNIIHNAYWPIFGELKVYDEFDCTSEDCPDPYTKWHIFVFILLMLYALAILVLVNLLIAMFNSTFEKIHEKSDTIWKYQRFFLIFSYFNYSSGPPPFNLIHRIVQLFIKFVKILKRGVLKLIALSGSNSSTDDVSKPVQKKMNPYVRFERQCAYEYWRTLAKENQETKKKHIPDQDEF